MPITDKGTIEYQIPIEFKNKFTKEIMKDFRKLVIDTFKQNDINQGRLPVDYENETYYSWWLFMEGTGGFYESFEYICNKYNLQEILEYYQTLPWYDSDLFDSEFGDLLVSYKLVDLGNPDDEV